MEKRNIPPDGTLAITRSIGFWMAVAMAVSQGLNAARAFLDPEGFAAYMGAPSAAVQLTAWVQIYGLRAAFIALLVGVFLVRRELSPLKWMAICALFMPLCDAWIVMQAGAPTSVIGRHLGIAVFLALAAMMLARDVARQKTAGHCK